MADEVSRSAVQVLEGKVDAVLANQDSIAQDLGGMNDNLVGLSDALDNATASGVDYSAALDQIQQLLVVCDLLLIVSVVLTILGCGMFFGHMITRWFRVA